jgi:pimeloyl-ACP methyl ester carboxylesterase
MTSATDRFSTTDHYFMRDDARLRFRDSGQGAALLLLHGWTLDLEMWQPQVDGLANAHRMLRFDRRGHGLSSGEPSISGDVQDALALCTHLGVDTFAVLGMSQGARVAMQLAAQAPRRVSHLAVDGPPDVVSDQNEDVPFDTLRTMARDHGMDAMRRAWAGNPLTKLHRADPAAQSLLEAMLARYPGTDLLTDTDSESSATPFETSAINARSLVISGERDLATRLSAAESLTRRLQNAERTVVPGAGHLPNLDNPRFYNDVLHRFLTH